ncbi:MAG: hypothetical protein R6V05_06475, partial [Candidatus Brocadiia bacterium]
MMDDTPHKAALPFRAGALFLLALVVACRPLASGLQYGMVGPAVFGLLLVTAGLLWAAAGLVGRGFEAQFGLPEWLFGAFVLICLASSLMAENWFAGVRWTWLMATYGLTGYLAMGLAREGRSRRFLLSCLVATGAAGAAYALWHRFLYVPVLQEWLEQDPALFQAALGGSADLLGQLSGRVASGRAHGSFITANQLAGFLALSLLPVAGLAA